MGSKSEDITRETDDGRTLVDLIAQLDEAKTHERNVKAHREEIERAVIDLTRFDMEEGSKTYTSESPSGSAKITLKQPVGRTIDAVAWKVAAKTLGPRLAKQLVTMKPSLDMKAVREYIKQNPTDWDAIVAPAVTSKPGKVGVSIVSVATFKVAN